MSISHPYTLLVENENNDTIAAIATPQGRGGIGIIRISGAKVSQIAQAILGHIPTPRYAEYTSFIDRHQQIIDQGIALYFAKPHSFTGEDVLELHGHGGPIILDCLLNQIIQYGARLARPGEFSERAFLNNKLDLTQAVAIADLIDAASEQAARAAIRSLQGKFSQYIHQLVEALIHIRAYVEAAIDFAEEEIDFLSENHINDTLEQLLQQLKTIQQQAHQGVLLREGIKVVIAGRPNAGKSSLLNALSGRDTAIVTDIPGTTRDVIREHIQIEGVPLHIFDTAGLRESTDQVEQEGIRRALQTVKQADRILLVIDSKEITHININQLCQEFFPAINVKSRLSIIRNKIDLLAEKPTISFNEDIPIIALSAKNSDGLILLQEHLKKCIGFTDNIEGDFSARRRHLAALQTAEQAILHGQQQLINHRAGELLAEDLRQAQNALSSITGGFTPDDLLGKIFASFCIGK